MSATMKQPIKNGQKDLVSILYDFWKNDDLFDASVSFLREGLGIVTYTGNLRRSANDFFRENDLEYQYVKKALGEVKAIFLVDKVARETFGNNMGATDVGRDADRYDGIRVFSCEAKGEISRNSIAALTKAFNRFYSVKDENYPETANHPVVVLFRHGKKLSIATCSREPKTACQDSIGEVIILDCIDCERPLKGHLQILGDMVNKIENCSTFEELYQALLKSLSTDIVSDNFFEKYIKFYKDNVLAVKNNDTLSREFRRFPDPEKAIHDYVKKLMGRIVFIQFLQRKGWMGVPVTDDSWMEGDTEFLQNLFERTEKKDKFVEEVLRPLFSDLNTKRKDDLASECLGSGIKIPYLNGGLFDKDEYDSVRFRLPEETMRKMLDFFRSFNFTIDENDEEAVEVGVDPEMLSRIFESLIEDNKKQGAYYTPKQIVTYMCREALIVYLQSDAKDESKKELFRNFIYDHKAEVLEPADLDFVERKLKSVKICDPAIGSGAFPMGMLKELLGCRRAIQLHRNGGECDSLQIKKDILQNSIYGVDIDKGAVDIARLRFWLTLIIDEKTPHALPNMDFKIMQGNSLLEQYDGVDLSRIQPVERKKGKGTKSLEGQLSLDVDDRSAAFNVQEAIRLYYKTDRHEEKTTLRKQINDYITDYIRHLKDCTPEMRKKIKALPIPNDKFFLWHIYFKEVFDEGGFDIVIGNPPYIRLQDMKQMSRVYEQCGFKTYNRAGDIYCLFTEHGFNLLKDGGTLCYIMMNKWMKADYGQPLRRFIVDRKIHRIVDFGDAQLFKKATTYPCIVLLGKSKPGDSFKACRLKNDDLELTDDLLDSFPTKEFDEEGWVTTSSKEFLLFKELKQKFTALNEYVETPAKYGIKPGLTEAILIAPETREKILKESISANEIIVPFYSGKGIRPYSQSEFNRYMILLRKGDTLKLMGKDQATEEEAWSFIKSRYPSVCNWLEQFAGDMRKRHDQGNYWWELRACTYYDLFERPKIIYQNVQVQSCFTYDMKGNLCNNSMWILPTEDKALLGLLNSRLGRWLVSDCCSQMQGGYQLDWVYFCRVPVALKKDGAVEREIASLVDQILAAKEEGSDTTDLERQIDGCLYEVYGLTNGEVKVIDPEAQTFGADFEPFRRKKDFCIVTEDELERIYKGLKRRFDKLSDYLEIEEKEVLGHYDLSLKTQPSKEELENAFEQWNCAILTAYRGSDELSREENKKRNEERNKELKAMMDGMDLLYRPVDGYYEELREGDEGVIKEYVNEFSFFVTNTSESGDALKAEEKDFFMKIYRLAEHYEQDSFLFTFPGKNRVAFLVATNKYGRAYFRNDAKFAGPLYTDIEDLSAWTGCSNEGKIAFMLKGMAQKKVKGTNRKVRIGEGDVFDIGHYNPNPNPYPDCLIVIHDGENEELSKSCSSYQSEIVPLYKWLINQADDIKAVVSSALDALPLNTKVVGFHCSGRVNGSYEEGARIAFEAVREWAATRRQLKKLVIVDMFGDYYKIQD